MNKDPREVKEPAWKNVWGVDIRSAKSSRREQPRYHRRCVRSAVGEPAMARVWRLLWVVGKQLADFEPAGSVMGSRSRREHRLPCWK